MSEREDPQLFDAGLDVTVDDVRALTGAATPHFAGHLRNRLERLVAPLAKDHPARQLADLEMIRLDRLAVQGEHGPKGGSDLEPLHPAIVVPQRRTAD